MQQTIQAQDRRIHENAREIAVLRSYKDEHFSTYRASYLKTLVALTPDSPKPWASVEDDINEIRELFQEDLTKACIEKEAFSSLYRTNFLNASAILHMPEIMRVMNLYADLEGLHEWRTERQLCERIIDHWHLWLDDGLLEEDDTFGSSWYVQLKDRFGW